jgi:hypothetical protein
MKRLIFFIILALLTSFSLSAQKVWEGAVVAGRYGDFPPAGYYGASNIFPRNSLVNVQNIANGKIVQVIISGGLEDPAFFLVLSRQASDALGLDRNDTANVRVSLAGMAGDPIVQGYSDFPYSDDPEVNPAARAGDANSAMEKNPLPPGYVPPAASAAPETPAAASAAPETPESPPKEPADETPSISSRVPIDSDEDFVIDEGPFAELPEEKPAISERMEANKDPGVTEDWTIIDEAELASRREEIAPDTGVLPAPGEPDAEIAAGPETAQPGTSGETEMETIITMEPALPRPPAGDEAPSNETLDSIIAEISETPAPADDGEWARENLPLVASLPEKSYYLQVASYKNPERVKPVVDSLKTTYPVYPIVVLTGGDAFYRVMVGPINEDERGLMLHQIRAEGYTDAFLRENK